MFDFSDVTRFALKLNMTPDPSFEDRWRREWSGKVAEEMRSLAPSDTGRLRASIQPSSEGVRVGVDYAGFVEYGTSDTAPQPFAGPSVNRLSRPAVEDAARQVLRDLT